MQFATTQFSILALAVLDSAKAAKASPVFTGTLTAPTSATATPRSDNVNAKVRKAAASGSIKGRIALQRFEYANNVNRSELLRLRGAFGFTSAGVDEAMIRAAAVSNPAPAG